MLSFILNKHLDRLRLENFKKKKWQSLVSSHKKKDLKKFRSEKTTHEGDPRTAMRLNSQIFLELPPMSGGGVGGGVRETGVGEKGFTI